MGLLKQRDRQVADKSYILVLLLISTLYGIDQNTFSPSLFYNMFTISETKGNL